MTKQQLDHIAAAYDRNNMRFIRLTQSDSLEAVLADGTRIEAHGENKFPPNYRDVMSALDALTAAAQKNALQQYTP